MDDLKITLVQSSIFWEEREKNLDHFSTLIGKLTNQTDLILLPETFNTGFSINPARCAEEMNGPSVSFLRDQAREKGAAIAATLLIREGHTTVNRFIFCYPDGAYATYDKRHLFRLSEEVKLFKPGLQRPVFQLKGWRLMPMICYDLRFPVWSRNSFTEGQYAYDLLIYLANWPIVRAYAWKAFLVARALENMAYVTGVNRIGIDGNGMDHTGDSMVVDAKGKVLFLAPEREEVVETITLSASDLKLYREAFAFALDWDRFTIDDLKPDA